MLLHDVIMTSYCCQRYAECLVMTLCSSRTVHRHTAPHMCNSWTTASRCQTFLFPICGLQTAQISVLWITRSELSCSIVSTTDIHSVDELKWRLIDVWCGLERSIFDEAIDQWQGRHRAYVHVKGGHFEYSLWTDNVDFVHICYSFNYKIMPATSANTFLFILQGSALADLRYGGRF